MAFPTHLGERIVGQVWRTEQGSVCVKVHGRVGVQRDCPDEVHACRHADLATATDAAAIERLLKSKRVVGLAITDSAKLLNIETD
jgi:hypothetical protein